MDDSYYGKGKWNDGPGTPGGRYSLVDHISDYIPIRQMALGAAIGFGVYLVVKIASCS